MGEGGEGAKVVFCKQRGAQEFWCAVIKQYPYISSLKEGAGGIMAPHSHTP